LVGIEPMQSNPVSHQRHERHEDSHGHEADANPEREPAFLVPLALQAKKLPERDAEFGHDEPKHDDADAGPNPGEERAFVGEVVGSFSVGVSHRMRGAKRGL